MRELLVGAVLEQGGEVDLEQGVLQVIRNEGNLIHEHDRHLLNIKEEFFIHLRSGVSPSNGLEACI